MPSTHEARIGQLLRLSAIEKQNSILVSALAFRCVERLGAERGWWTGMRR
jgi:hypothetical protein